MLFLFMLAPRLCLSLLQLLLFCLLLLLSRVAAVIVHGVWAYCSLCCFVAFAFGALGLDVDFVVLVGVAVVGGAVVHGVGLVVVVLVVVAGCGVGVGCVLALVVVVALLSLL